MIIIFNFIFFNAFLKHTLGGTSSRPNAGIEPKDSLKLFGSSVGGGKKRYAIDREGRIHQFNSNKEGTVGIGLDEQEKIKGLNSG